MDELKAYLERHIRLCVEDLKLIAHEVNDTVSWDDLTLDTVASLIWGGGDNADVCHASHTCGRLTQLFHLADTLVVQLHPDVKELRPWCTAINPSE